MSVLTQKCAERRGARIKRAATIACVKRVISTIMKPKAALVSGCLTQCSEEQMKVWGHGRQTNKDCIPFHILIKQGINV